jgi:glutaredoxin
MNFEEPIKNGFTIYSKSGCPNCKNVKEILKKENLDFVIIDCDEYLLFEKDDFLLFIENTIGKKYTTFPMIFSDGKFLGGITQVRELLQK